ncbi:MAG: hypothetical protein HOV71_12145 [Hamadaea sp.]|uniref:hypothetical protein n=1 Tax=Hamadaea sp. NPDC050747 TaxID=3155789 RepID=UPI001848031D|nr:hypothetical protein [Hamadaea sp.]NUR48880.1 hypothetical protein [Hamadaea sp.]NUT05236.1 hypothetical protein [Hamadaea sp.]
MTPPPDGSESAAQRTDDAPGPVRTRVVLAEIATPRRGGDPADPAAVQDVLLRGLVRAQLALALRLAVVVLVGLGTLPLLFSLAPSFGEVRIAGFRLPWLLLGFLAYPFLIAVGVAFVRLADRNETDYAALHRDAGGDRR